MISQEPPDYLSAMPVSSLSSKGQVTIPKAVREHLDLKPGHAVEFVIRSDGQVVLLKRFESARPLRGIFRDFAPSKPVSLEELDEAIAHETARLDAGSREGTS